MKAEERPILFARSGQNVTVPIRGDLVSPDAVVTRMAYGQQWGEPVAVKDGKAEFIAPTVRVPVVFRLLLAKGLAAEARGELGDMIVYPDRSLPWDDDAQLVAVEAPAWFNAWSQAVGLPVERLEQSPSPQANTWRARKKRALLVLGRKAAGRDLTAIEQLAATHQASVLVLEADWLGNAETMTEPLVVSPKHAGGALADLKSQDWASSPTFHRRVACWPGLANRQAWLGSEEQPFVEEVFGERKETESLRIVLNYLPWQEQLGRCEMADELFLRLLLETAKRRAAGPGIPAAFDATVDPVERGGKESLSGALR